MACKTSTCHSRWKFFFGPGVYSYVSIYEKFRYPGNATYTRYCDAGKWILVVWWKGEIDTSSASYWIKIKYQIHYDQFNASKSTIYSSDHEKRWSQHNLDITIKPSQHNTDARCGMRIIGQSLDGADSARDRWLSIKTASFLKFPHNPD